MQRLTGKRSIKTYEVTSKDQQINEEQKFTPAQMTVKMGKQLMFTNNSVLEPIIRSGC